MRPVRLTTIMVTLAATALLGCGGPAGDGEPGSGPVAISDFAFDPAEMTVAAGQEVVWQNESDTTTHTVKGKGFASEDIDPGDSYATTFDAAGSYDYVCTIHPQMKGTIVVEP